MLSLPHNIDFDFIFLPSKSKKLFFQNSSTISLVCARPTEPTESTKIGTQLRCSIYQLMKIFCLEKQRARETSKRNFFITQQSSSLPSSSAMFTVPLQFRVDSFPLHCCMWVGGGGEKVKTRSHNNANVPSYHTVRLPIERVLRQRRTEHKNKKKPLRQQQQQQQQQKSAH